ncbi:MAG: protein kinase [Verrucomicrobiae bacterium]|nr:protein kinase [Verrucomicrobiae bacterium]
MPPEPPPKTTSTTGQPSWMAPVMPVVPDHELIRRIGGGSYGDVWLARTTVGTWRAVKVVFRDRFTDARPYEREFNGIQKFEPLSRGNEAFIDILQIGRNDAAGYFYYVMELADDAVTPVFQPASSDHPSSAAESDSPTGKSALQPNSYIPKTLSKVLLQRGRLPVSECLELGLTLNLGLAHLHKAGLIHRDIKPSNIIFVGGVPKLADIGLVIELAEARSIVGTEGFIPPEGPNSPQADLYSLGKVLYEAGMGKDRKDFPEPYTQIAEAPDATALLEFNAILLKACTANREERYQSAEEMNVDLALLQSGGSVRRQRRLAGQLRFVQRVGAVITALAAVIALGWWWQAKQTRVVRELAEENLTLARRADDNAMQAKQNELNTTS